MTQENDILRRSRGELERALRDAGAVFRGAAVKCPFHDDAHPSGSVYADESGVWRFACHTSTCGFAGDVFDVKARSSGRKVEDVLIELTRANEPKAAPKIYATITAMVSALSASTRYVYAHPDTKAAEMVVLRCETSDGGKTFLQASPCAGGFWLKAPKKPWPIYNRARVRSADMVIVVEGEKCVHALHGVGFVATTSPAGSANADKADWTPLAGKTVILWPDNDDAGRKYMANVAEILQKLDPMPLVKIIDIADMSLPPKGDVVEFLAEYGGDTPESKRNSIECALMLAASVDGASAGVSRIIEDTISGKRFAAPWPFPAMSRLTKALLPGTITALCGDPGDGKSFMVIQAAAHLYANGIRVAVKMLEEDQAYHLHRALAQLCGDSGVVDDDWIKNNPDASRKILRDHQQFLDEFGRCIHAVGDEMQTLDQLAEWTEQQAKSGARVIVIDPITMAETSAKPWIDDLRFLAKAKATVRRHEASLLLVTHPRKGNRSGAPSLHDLAGGAAYQRFTQTVLWVRKFDQRKKAKCYGEFGSFETNLNRAVKLGKTRNGRGGGLEIGFDFSGKTLRFAEQGVIVKWIKQKHSDSDDTEDA